MTLGSRKGVDCEIPHWLERGEQDSPVPVSGPQGVDCGWRREQNISYEGVKTLSGSPRNQPSHRSR